MLILMKGRLEMSLQNYLIPAEIAEVTIQTAIKKTKMPIENMLILGILAGFLLHLLQRVQTWQLSTCLQNLKPMD